MKIEIYLDAAKLDITNVSIKDFNKDAQDKKELLSRYKLDFSSMSKLKGEKTLLEKSFQQQKAESLNL
jgi:hypothetical protein